MVMTYKDKNYKISVSKGTLEIISQSSLIFEMRKLRLSSRPRARQ